MLYSPARVLSLPIRNNLAQVYVPCPNIPAVISKTQPVCFPSMMLLHFPLPLPPLFFFPRGPRGGGLGRGMGEGRGGGRGREHHRLKDYRGERAKNKAVGKG